MKLIANSFWILLGWGMCLTTAFIGWFYRETHLVKLDTPWASGLILNVLKAASKYNTKSWLMRCKGIWHNPSLTLQYIKILSNKSPELIGPIKAWRSVDSLAPSHDVDTASAYHRKRVADLKAGIEPHSQFGNIVVVNHVIHDGHHRVAAYKEAGMRYIEVQQYIDCRPESGD